MAWDPAKPAGSQKLRLADDDIRANFAALEVVFGDLIDEAEAITASVAEINGAAIAAGTIALFGQNSAPTGWTRKADWQDNAMLCYAASGNIGSGGSVNPQSAHTHTGPSHTHTGPSHAHGPGSFSAAAHVHQWYKDGGAAADITYNSSGSETAIAEETKQASQRHIAVNPASGGSSVDGPDDSYTSAVALNVIGGSDYAGTGATGAGGTGATGSNTAPHYQEVIAATKDAYA